MNRRIAYISGSIIPSRQANSVHVMKMCQALAQRGHHVVLTVIAGEPGEVDDFSYYGVEPCFTIVKHAMRGRGLLDRAAYARAVPDMVRRDGEPDLHYGRHLPGLLCATRAGTPFVYEVHEASSGLVRWFERRLVHRPNLARLVVITEALRDEYRRRHPHLAERIVVAADAADPPRRMDEVADIRRSSDRLQVGYIGQLHPGKGMELVAEVAARAPEVDFHVVGGSEQDIDTWRHRVSRCDNIVFHGFVPPARTEAYRQAMDVLLAPYQNSVRGADRRTDLARWMSPLKVFEYMASRRPMIASDLPVLREVLDDGETAMLVPPGDVDAWVGALHRLTDADARAALAGRAFEAFERRHTWAARAGAVIEGLAA